MQIEVLSTVFLQMIDFKYYDGYMRFYAVVAEQSAHSEHPSVQRVHQPLRFLM